MNISDRLNHLMPGADRVERIKEDGRYNPSRLESAWLGFSLILVELPKLLIINLVSFLWALFMCCVTFCMTLASTVVWVVIGLLLGMFGKMERSPHE